MNILNWAKESNAKNKKKNVAQGKKIRKNTLDYAATKGGPIGNIARARKKKDALLDKIMEN